MPEGIFLTEADMFMFDIPYGNKSLYIRYSTENKFKNSFKVPFVYGKMNDYTKIFKMIKKEYEKVLN